MPTLPATLMEGQPIWSNDGTRLLIWRCVQPSEGGECASKLAVISADGRDAGIQLEADVLPFDDSLATQLWAPDDASVLAAIQDTQGSSGSRLLQWDPLTGATQALTWNPSG